jgi:hypothetical protein
MQQLERSDTGRSASDVWWNAPFLPAALMLLSTAPLWFTTVPPLIDLPGHMGRYYVELNLAHSPALQRYWDFHWRLIGNLGADLLVAPLAAAFGLQRAVWAIALSLPPLMIWGIARMSRALHGQVTPFALAAAPFALAYPYQYGFLNYWLASGLAFHAFASWVEADAGRLPGTRRAALFAPAAGLIWLAHAYGWAILVVLVGAYELCRNWRREVSAWGQVVLTILGRVWPILLPALLMLAWRQGGGGGQAADFFNFGRKLAALFCTLRDQNIWLDSVSLIFAGTLLYFGLRDRSARVAAALVVAAAVILALILLMPGQMFGSHYADIRLWPIFFIVGLAAIAPANAGWRGASVIAGVALALFVVRIGATSAGFAAYDQSYARHLRALDYAPEGASIAVLTYDPNCEGWRHERVAHIGSLAIVRKDAFVNSQWEIPGGLLITPLHASGTAFNADPSENVGPPGCHGPIGPALQEKFRQIPRDRFDYVWLLGFDPRVVQPPPGVRLLYSDDRSAFYELRSPSLQATTSPPPQPARAGG